MNDAPTVVCYGDSNTHGFDVAMFGRLGRTARWPGVLAAELGPSAAVVEEGLNGRTTIWDDPFEEGRSGRAYLGPCLASHAPVGVLVIMLGTNDSKLSFHLGATEIANGAGALVDLALRSGSGPDGGPPAVLLVVPPLLGPASPSSTPVRSRPSTRRTVSTSTSVATAPWAWPWRTRSARCSPGDPERRRPGLTGGRSTAHPGGAPRAWVSLGSRAYHVHASETAGRSRAGGRPSA